MTLVLPDSAPAITSEGPVQNSTCSTLRKDLNYLIAFPLRADCFIFLLSKIQKYSIYVGIEKDQTYYRCGLINQQFGIKPFNELIINMLQHRLT